MPKPRRPVAVQERQTTEVRTEPRPQVEARAKVEARPAEIDGLWGIAMLRIAMELKRPGAPGLDEIVGGVVARMGIPQEQFEDFLAQNCGLLTQAARERGYAP